MPVLASKVGQTFPPCRRIRQQTGYELAFRARCLTNKWFAVYVRENEGGIARLGAVAGKRVMPKAVSRNFAKRLIREVFRREFPAEQALDIVVRVRRQINPKSSAEGRQALAQLFRAVQA